MPWGNFPIIGIILGLAGGVIQARLLKSLAQQVGKSASIMLMVLLLLAKLAVYGVFLTVCFLISVLDGTLCGTLMVLTIVGISVAPIFMKRGNNR